MRNRLGSWFAISVAGAVAATILSIVGCRSPSSAPTRQVPDAAGPDSAEGSTPSGASDAYTAPLPLRRSAVVQAIAVAPGYAPSAVATAVIEVLEIPPDLFSPVTYSPAGGSYDHALDVALNPASSGSNAICFTTDGTTPACTPSPEVCNAADDVVLAQPAAGWCAPGSSQYTAPIHVEPSGDGGTAVLKAVSCEIRRKDVVSSTYTFTQ